MKNNTIDFVDEKGNKSEMIITSNGEGKINLKPNYKLQTPEFNNKYMKKGAKPKSMFTTDIGVKSEGFAQIVTIATLIAIGAIAITLLIWRL